MKRQLVQDLIELEQVDENRVTGRKPNWIKKPWPSAEYFLLRHADWPAIVCPIIKGGLNDQAVDHSHAVPAARQLHDPQG
ncbi:TPA: hypothetical protein NII67_006100 [Pseudomonas aeruginosa]|nr:hypothetical protein [Pseudomonas aeruginosa]